MPTTAPAHRPGADATRPLDIPRAGWKQVLKRTKDEIGRDRVTLLAAGVAFYAMLALVPAMIAFVAIYGLMADPRSVEESAASYLSGLPADARSLIEDQLKDVVSRSTGELGWTLALSVLAALWSASSAMVGLTKSLNAAYGEREKRGFVKLRGTALLMTLGGLIAMILFIGGVAATPVILDQVGLGAAAETAIAWGRWPLLLLLAGTAIAALYRWAPSRARPKWRWVTPGSIVACVIWLLASLAFSFYVENFGSYNETYGSLGAVVVLLLWLFLSALAVILGAELDAELERQTARDTTTGNPRPQGERGAIVADEPPATSRHGSAEPSR